MRRVPSFACARRSSARWRWSISVSHGTAGAQPPRILIHANYFETGFGGTPEAVLLLARWLGRQGFAVDLRFRRGFLADIAALRALPEAPAAPGCRPRPMVDYAAVILAGAWIPWALAAALAARRCGIPAVYAPRGQLCRVEFTSFRDLRKMIYLVAIEFWAILLCRRIHFTSALEARETLLPRWLKGRRGFVAPEAVERAPSSTRVPRPRAGPLRLGFIAQVSPRKGLRELVAGFLMLVERRPDIEFELTVAGTPLRAMERYFESAHARAAAHLAGRRITFAGQISGARLAQFYGDSDAVVVPSRFESFGLVPIEALRHGCVVLAAARIGVLEFLDRGPRLRLLDGISPGAIAAALEALWDEWPRLAAGTDGPHDRGRARLDDDAALAPLLVALSSLLPRRRKC